MSHTASRQLKRKQNEEKLSRYINIYNILLKKDSLDNVQNVFKDSISESLSNKKSNLNELVYSCIKLEILAKLDSLKKYQDLRHLSNSYFHKLYSKVYIYEYMIVLYLSLLYGQYRHHLK